jgi:two-component system CheB/CheR fusion protein
MRAMLAMRAMRAMRAVGGGPYAAAAQPSGLPIVPIMAHRARAPSRWFARSQEKRSLNPRRAAPPDGGAQFDDDCSTTVGGSGGGSGGEPGARQGAAASRLASFDAALARSAAGHDPFAAAVWETRMPIVITNPRLPDNPMVFVNNAFCALTGYTREELVGRNCRCLQGAQTDPASVARLRDAVDRHSRLDLEIRNYRKDGTAFWGQLHMVPVQAADGALSYFFASVIDVTRERERLAALQGQDAALLAATAARAQADAANAEKSRFLAVASHDIRQPLQSLVLLQGALADSVHGQAAEKLVARLGQTLDSMSSMLNALLDLNQIEAGAVRTDIAEIRIGDILERIRDGFAHDAQAKGLRLRVVPCSLCVRSDARLLEQILRNLLANALKFTRQGNVLIGCRRFGATLRVEVWDTGIGIEKPAIATIFREYHQLDTVGDRSARGLGLGLAIVQRFAGLLGHPIVVHSTLGKGSMFGIELPRAHAAEAARPVAPPPQPVAHGARSGGTILLVDDDPQTCEILTALLSGDGYRVIVAADGARALRMLRGADPAPDLLLTDARLPPESSGAAFATRLRHLLARNIPVITLTGDVSTGAGLGGTLGNSLRLTKPVKPRELCQAIARLLAAAPPPAPQAAAGGQSLAGTVVFVVDDNEQVSEAIRAVIQSAAGTAETFDSAEAFLAAYRPGGRACLLIDAYLPGIGGIDLLRRLRAGGDALPAIMITGNSDVAMAVQAMKAGASDFIEKPVAAAQLLASVLNTMELCHDSARLASWRQAANQHLAGLTARQRQIMTLVLAGHPSKNIAVDLGISQRTVENHRASIMRKAGTRSLPALARLALAADWDGADGPLHA